MKQSTKRFLKPNKKKIAIFVVIIVIAYLSTFFLPGAGDKPKIGSSFFTGLFIVLTLPLFISDFSAGILGLLSLSFLIPISLFFILIYLYFLSCLMYLFFNGLLKKGEGGRYTIVILTLIILCVLIISIYIDKVNRDNWMPSGVDAKRISDIRQISLAMEKVYDNEGRYPEITTTTNGRIDIEIIGHLDPVPRDIGYGTVVGCNDIKDAPYRGFNNTSDRSKYCIYACLEKGGFFAASHKGIKLLKKEPNSLDCW